MVVGLCKIYMRADWARSLKDKRMEIRSLTDKTRHRFNISIAEVADNDVINSIVLGFACVTNEFSHAEEMISKAAGFIENISDSEIIKIEKDLDKF